MPLRKLTLTQEQHGDLWEELNRSRKSSVFVTVPRAALSNMLNDHAHLIEQFPADDIREAEERGGARDE